MDVKKQNQMIELLESFCEELGWVIGILADDPEQKADGLIIGPEEFVYETLSKYDSEYDVVTKELSDESMKDLPKSKSRKLFH